MSAKHRVFEERAEEYDRWYEEHRSEYHAELAHLRCVLPVIDTSAIEVGVGSGRFAVPLGIPLGIEPSHALGRMARQRGIEVIRGRAECIPIKNGSCSSILLVTVICYLDDPVLAFRELHRILVPQGFLVIGFIEREGIIVHKFLHEREKHRFLSHARFYSLPEVQELLEDSRFHMLTVDSWAGFCIVSAQKG